ncbi:MAG TPA: NADPH-dependent F420 reductase [Acidimicrobiales bacterium]|nr:NADPH-dependent F420 reductase [Acidimicrobiales bacterium]
MHVGILGGTGPAGRGLAVRLAAAGHEVVLGSRDAERAQAVAAELVGAYPDRALSLSGADNPGAAGAALVVVGTPWDSAVATVRPLREELAGKVVVSMAVALVKVGREIQAVTLGRGSMAASLQAALPGAHVAASLHHLPAGELEDLDSGLVADVLVCSDFRDAKEATMALVNSIEGLRALDAGSLGRAAAIEAFTSVCVGLNIRYKAATTLRVGGIST